MSFGVHTKRNIAEPPPDVYDYGAHTPARLQTSQSHAASSTCFNISSRYCGIRLLTPREQCALGLSAANYGYLH